MGDGVTLLFEEKGWIDKLTQNQKKNPRKYLTIEKRLPKNKPKEWIERLFLTPIKINCNGKPASYKMRVMLLALNLRNYAGHNIRKQDVFVEKYPQIVDWLLSAIFIAVSSLPKPEKKTKLPKAPQPSKPKAKIAPKSTTSTTKTSNQTVVTSYPMGTLGFEE